MGKLTNKYNLPEPLVKAIRNDKYHRTGDISVTQLIDSPRVRVLKSKHYDEIEEDAIDMVWALFGSATHSIIERAAEGVEDYLSEVSLEYKLMGKVLSGTADLYDKKTKTLYDFKVTSSWNITFSPDHWQWEAQLNCYAHMLRAIGYEVKAIKIIAILKDWKRSEADRNFSTGKYPQKQIAEVDLPVYSAAAMEKYINRKMSEHIQAMDGDELPECNERERWSKPNTYAVKDPTKKRALKICETEEDAKNHIKLLTEKEAKKRALVVELREGKDIRCEGYCSVAPFCSQFINKYHYGK